MTDGLNPDDLQPYGEPAASTPPASATAAKRSPGVILGVAVGILALGGGAVFALSNAGNETNSGANTPEDAVQALFDAAENEDILGVLEVLDPGEREAFVDFTDQVIPELQRLNVLSDDLDLNDVRGVDLDFEGLAYETTTVTPGLAQVQVISGTLAASSQPDELPLGSLFDEITADAEPAVGEPEEADDDTRITTVQRDGKWHVSLWYSIAEEARQSEGLPAITVGEGLQPNGGDDPVDAVRDMLQQAADLSAGGVISLLDPVEAAVLYDYGPLFVDDADAAVAQMKQETGYSATITEFDGEVDDLGNGRSRVKMTKLAFEGSAEGTTMRFSTGDGCTIIELEGEILESDALQFFPVPLGECLEDADYSQLEQDLGAAFGPLGFLGLGSVDEQGVPELGFPELNIGVITQERDGKHYVRPLGTFTDGLTQFLKTLEPQTLEEIVNGFFGFFLGFGEGFDSETFESSGTVIGDEPFADEGIDFDGEFSQDFEEFERCGEIIDRVYAERAQTGDDSLQPSTEEWGSCTEIFGPVDEVFFVFDG